MTYALSTMWMQHRFEDLRSFWDAASGMGFPAIELSHIVTEKMAEGLPEGEFPVLYTHYPAPKVPSPFGYSADMLLASPDESARAWALERAERSLQFAARMGARAVCVHLGGIPVEVPLEAALEQRYLAGQKGTAVYRRALEAVRTARAERAAVHFDAARRSLEAIARLAAPLGLQVGMESRRYYLEIPNFEETALLLSEHDAEVVGFWYDSGHVQVLENLGFHRHQDWLESFADRMVGVHLHDVVDLRDHLLPGIGKLDFEKIGRFLPAEVGVTLELDWFFEAGEIVDAVAFLKRAGCLRAS